MKLPWKKIAGWGAGSVTALLIATALIILNPRWLYARATPHGAFLIYSNAPPDPRLLRDLDSVDRIIRGSELYDPNLKIGLCLNEASLYTRLIAATFPPGFAWAPADNVVLNGTMDVPRNSVTLNAYAFNLIQLLAHEATHCLRYNRLGMIATGPFSSIPTWKNEGYCEYVGRGGGTDEDLARDVAHLIRRESTANDGWISFPDSTGTTIPYYRSRLLVQYALNVKRMTYAQLLDDTTSEETLLGEMMRWYRAR